MIKVNLFFNKDSQDMENFLADIVQTDWVRKGLVKPDWDDTEGTALFVDGDIISRFFEIAKEHGIIVK
jgi:hypothetical protein